MHIYVDENCVEKSVCHRPKFSTVDHQNNFLTKYHYCVMENSLQNLVNVVKNALQQLIVAYLLKLQIIPLISFCSLDKYKSPIEFKINVEIVNFV